MENTEENQYEHIDKIINKVLEERLGTATCDTMSLLRAVVIEALAQRAWEKCADDLIDYAHDFVAHLSTWGKGYDYYDKQIKLAEDAIEEYYRLKNNL